MFLSFICTDGISSFRSTWDCTGMRSFRYQAQKYPKWSTIYVRRNSIVLLPFTVINQHMGLHRNAEFTYWAFRTPKVNLSGISLKRATNQNLITFRNYGNWVTVKSDRLATSLSWLTHDIRWVICFNKIVQIASKPKCFRGIFIFISTNILGQSDSLINQTFLY